MTSENRSIDIAIIGAGFAGMYMLHKARELGFTATVFETGDDVGGTWYWNRYPGARCDIESMEYSYQFSEELQQEWQWTERYSAQPEILAYANHVADRFNLRKDIQFETRVVAARYDEATQAWLISSQQNDITLPETKAQFLVAATGCLSVPNTPHIDEQNEFKGNIYHTGKWPHTPVDFSGKKVAVIGTGSSGIQAIPLIAKQAKHLTVFQRTASYSVPAQNHLLDTGQEKAIKADYKNFRAANKLQISGYGSTHPSNDESILDATEQQRKETLERHWLLGGLLYLPAFGDLLFDQKANAIAAKFVQEKIAEKIDNPELAEKLVPKGLLGCKRLCADTGYYETFNRDNVELVDINDTPIDKLVENGIQCRDQTHQFDAIVFATGFDALTGALNRIDIRGKGGQSLKEKWAHGPRNYLGLKVAGFPNFFFVAGPGSPSVLTNMLPSIEQHVDWISDCLAHLRTHKKRSIETSVSAEERWTQQLNDMAKQTIFPHCNSWYLGANIPGKARVFSPFLGFPEYVALCNDVASNGYAGFELN